MCGMRSPAALVDARTGTRARSGAHTASARAKHHAPADRLDRASSVSLTSPLGASRGAYIPPPVRTAFAAWLTVVQRLSRTLLQLNIATRRYHDAADAPWLDLMVPSVDPQDYVEHLVKIYGFEAPLEAALRYTPGLSALIDLRARTRSGLLAQDLMRLGVSASQIAKLPQRFVAFSDAVDALGWMYVVERSALRHGGVLRYLVEHLPEVNRASSYLAAYDAATGNRWSELGAALDSVGHSASVVHQLVRSANQGFQALRDWFSDGDSGVRESMIHVDTEPHEKRRRHR